jgi:hypothetical protein
LVLDYGKAYGNLNRDKIWGILLGDKILPHSVDGNEKFVQKYSDLDKISD